VKFEIWDTAGQEKYRSLAPLYYRGASAALVVYDITNKESFDNARKWIQEVQTQEGQHVVIGLAGNKVDLEGQRQVKTEEGQTFAQDNGFIFYETSAKNCTNIHEMFKAIAKAVPSQNPPSKQKGVVLDDPNTDGKKCACSLL
jgi:small GTP-binding protein